MRSDTKKMVFFVFPSKKMVLDGKTNFFLRKKMVLDRKTNFFLGKKDGFGQKNQLFPRKNKKKHLLGNYAAKLHKDGFFGFP